ncbi:subtilisin-like protein [Backusella circina FSU 941]|nr:subtilisin-like protein [Backusella circina FSU 941]
MKYTALSLVCASLLSILNGVSARKNDNPILQSILSDPKFVPNELGNILPGRYIVEFEDDYRGSSLEFVSDIASEIKQTEPASHIKMTIAHDYGSSIFRGISISLTAFEPNTLAKREIDDTLRSAEHTVLRQILRQNRVKHIYPVTEISRPKVIPFDFDDVYKNSSKSAEVPKLDMPANSPALPFSHIMAQVDRVRNELNLTGEGITVGVVDSGIDYHHEAFGGGFGPGYRVQLGYDLVGDRFDSNDPHSVQTNDTPLDACPEGNGHGTHVAGIIAADDSFYNFTGVAPKVRLGAWRVFGCSGATSNDLVIKALIDAHESGCDIINLSLGTGNNWPEDASAVVSERIANKGTVVIAAAGNDGEQGAFYISSPGSSPKTVSVASVDNAYNLERYVETENGEQYPYTFDPATSLFPKGKIVLYSNSSDPHDACIGHSPSQNLTGLIALVHRGSCTFTEKAHTVERQGAIGVVFYDNEDEDALFKPQVLNSTIPTAAISSEAGNGIKKLIETTHKGGVDIEFKNTLSPRRVKTASQASLFSSVGPLYDLSLKPDIAGVGGFIFSTLPRNLGSYGMLSGTSMAAPFITGCYSLYMQAHGKKDPLYITEQFQNYARPTLHNDDIENPAIQGAGLIQLYDAIRENVHISPAKLSFNDTDNIGTRRFTVSNPGKETVEYVLRNYPSLALAPFNTSLQGFAPVQPVSYATNNVYAQLRFSTDTVTLRPGEEKEIEATKLPIFDKDFPQLVTRPSVPLLEEIDQETGEERLHFLIDRTKQVSSYVISAFRLLTGTKELRTEVLDSSQKYLGLANVHHNIGRNTKAKHDFIFTNRWNATYIPEGSEDIANLEPLNNGTYYLRYKALKLLSDPQKEDSWVTVVSDPIHVLR